MTNQEAAFFQAASRAIQKVVQGYCRVGWRHLEEEMRQEAWVKILGDRASYDPDRANPETWCKMVISRHLVGVIGRSTSPFYLTRGEIKKRRQRGREWPTSLTACPAFRPPGGQPADQADPLAPPDVEAIPDIRPRQDASLVQEEGAQIRAGWQGRVRQVVDQVVGGWTGRDRQIVTRLLDLDGQQAGTPQEVAQTMGCRLNRVMQAHRRLEQELTRNAVAYVLYNQMGDCCEEEDSARDQPATG